MSALRAQEPRPMVERSLEARPEELRARVTDVRLRLGVPGEHRHDEDYGPGSHLSEAMLFHAYRRTEDEERP